MHGNIQKFINMDEIEWNVINEGQLLDAMVGHKPVGVNKYFQMAFICDKFTENIQKEISSEKVWKHLETMYNLEALDESESIPFPNIEKDFALPESDFGSLLIKKEEERKQVQKGGRETPKLVKEIKKEEKPEKEKIRNSKERRDSKDSKDKPVTNSVKKEAKKEGEKLKPGRGRSNSTPSTPKEDTKGKSKKDEETPKPAKRPTRGSLKPDDSSSSGKSSPTTVTPTNVKRRRI